MVLPNPDAKEEAATFSASMIIAAVLESYQHIFILWRLQMGEAKQITQQEKTIPSLKKITCRKVYVVKNI